MTVGELIERMSKRYDNDAIIACAVWDAADVEDIFDNMVLVGVEPLTDKEITSVLDFVENNTDYSLGISESNIEAAINLIINRREE